MIMVALATEKQLEEKWITKVKEDWKKKWQSFSSLGKAKLIPIGTSTFVSLSIAAGVRCSVRTAYRRLAEAGAWLEIVRARNLDSFEWVTWVLKDLLSLAKNIKGKGWPGALNTLTGLWTSGTSAVDRRVAFHAGFPWRKTSCSSHAWRAVRRLLHHGTWPIRQRECDCMSRDLARRKVGSRCNQKEPQRRSLQGRDRFTCRSAHHERRGSHLPRCQCSITSTITVKRAIMNSRIFWLFLSHRSYHTSLQ